MVWKCCGRAFQAPDDLAVPKFYQGRHARLRFALPGPVRGEGMGFPDPGSTVVSGLCGVRLSIFVLDPGSAAIHGLSGVKPCVLNLASGWWVCTGSAGQPMFLDPGSAAIHGLSGVKPCVSNLASGWWVCTGSAGQPMLLDPGSAAIHGLSGVKPSWLYFGARRTAPSRRMVVPLM